MINNNALLTLDVNLQLDIQKETIIKNGLQLSLSRIQFKLLFYLVCNKKVPISSEELIQYAWGKNDYITKDELYVYICRLRKRIEDDFKNPKLLLSIRRVGYMYYPPQFVELNSKI
ncbi:transcriptional regulator [Bacillus thuringiensis]|uniref:Transcriptional regulator n=1 Tax=Bacillus thuringiensis TaxID=1428 RepID=A0A9X7GAU2_BACTU|nr:winged helix-turn-helix domain-containing protein [Bacillus thuringiensis]MED4444053.1 winged helix-turn-helix domain-containing protein [Bacillus cereus]PEB45138.1 transcriptional regulator [Bacillus thuringiensis]PED27332.1 transcriptional regulator [Bacillus thuringiensis]PFV25843.1 transcriptional regulator [Bacillus thuringiensis]PGN17698.1 transcriptional regulator [Bacillus thuringiensis]